MVAGELQTCGLRGARGGNASPKDAGRGREASGQVHCLTTRTISERALSRAVLASRTNAATWSVCGPDAIWGSEHVHAKRPLVDVASHDTSATSVRLLSTKIAYGNVESSPASGAGWSHPKRSTPVITSPLPEPGAPDAPPHAERTTAASMAKGRGLMTYDSGLMVAQGL